MIECSNCGGELHVTHAFRVQNGVRTKRVKCENCGKVRVSVDVLLDENEPRGARALATDIKKNGLKALDRNGNK